MKSLKRLTRRIVEQAERGGYGRGWYKLCAAGYLPEEIAIYSSSKSAYRDLIRGRVVDYARANELPIPSSCAPKRDFVRKQVEITDFREAFRASVMRTGLALVLTQPMLEKLCAISDGVASDRHLYCQELGQVRPDNFIATGNALEKRGLIGPDSKLTKIGEIVVALLKEANVFVVSDAALAKRKKVGT